MGDRTKFLVLEYLSSLKAENGDKVDAIDTVLGLLEEQFPSAKQVVENFEDYSYYPVSLDDIIEAGVSKLELATYKDTAESVKSNPKFEAFLDVVVNKGFFNGTEEGSMEYAQRYAKLIQKFQEKMKRSEPSQQDMENEAEDFKNLGNKAINAKNFDEAEAMYSKALELSADGPSSHIYYSNRAAAYSYMEKYPEAIEDCLASLALSPDYIKAYSRLGWVYFKTKKYEEAIQAYERAVELEPSNEANKTSLAQAKEKAKKELNKRNAGGDIGATPGGMPDMAGMMNNPMMKSAMDKVGGQAGLASLMKNPQMMQMAQQMMKDPAMMEQAMSMLGGGGGAGGGGGMPDMSALASMMGGMGGGDGALPSSSAPSSSSSKKTFKGFED